MIPQFSIPANPYTYDDLADLTHTEIRAEFDRAPIAKLGETIKLTITFLNEMYDPCNLFPKASSSRGVVRSTSILCTTLQGAGGLTSSPGMCR